MNEVIFIAIIAFTAGSLMSLVLTRLWAFSYGDREYWLGHRHGLRQGHHEARWGK